MTKLQARFWVDHKGSPVRIKLNKGQSLGHSYGGATDEGYSRTSEEYSFDGRTVVCQWHTDGRDCDGRMIRSGEMLCHVDQLRENLFDGYRYPRWYHREARQRDFSAEAMNY